MAQDAPGKYFSLAGNHIVHETLDGEAVIINLNQGYYYSLNRTGTRLWNVLLEGAGREEAIAEMEQQFEGEATLIRAASQDLIRRLLEEELLVPASCAGASPVAGEPAGTKLPFEVPSFRKFTDMQNFLLVDPIHDTSELGWPETRTGGS